MVTPPASTRTEPRVATVRSLVEDMAKGLIRIPGFQRQFRWEPQDIADLFDSLLKNYPIGTVLLWQTRQEARSYQLGPVRVHAEAQDCLLVVDGQQRLLSLLGCMRHPWSRIEDVPPEHRRFFLWHNLRTGAFVQAASVKAGADEFIPVNVLGEPNTLLSWSAEHLVGKRDLVDRAFEVSSRLREYQLPYYEIRHAQLATVKEVFSRLNTHGHQLKWEELYEGLMGNLDTTTQALERVSKELRDLGFGGVPGRVILMAALACMGWDLTRNLRAGVEQAAKHNATEQALPAMRSAAVFFNKAGLRGFQAVTFLHLFAVIARFFHLHPTPHPRNVVLLRRFVWRGLVAGAFGGDRRPVTRQLQAAVTPDEDATLQALLALVPRVPPQVKVPTLDSRSALNRLLFVAMQNQAPRDWGSGQVVEVPMPTQFSVLGRVAAGANEAKARTLANRLTLPIPGRKDAQEAALAGFRPSEAVLGSHLLDGEMWTDLASGREDAVLERRAALLEKALSDMIGGRAEWDMNDNPPIRVRVRKAG